MATKNPYDSGKYDAVFRTTAKAVSTTTGVPESVLHAALTVLAKKESTFKPDAIGKVKLDDGTHAEGMFQYRPTTSKMLGINPFDVAQSAMAAANDAAKAFKRGGVAEIAASHFAGAGGSGRGPNTRAYVRDFLDGMSAVGAPAHRFAPDRTPPRGRQNAEAPAPAEGNPFAAMAAAPEAMPVEAPAPVAEAPAENPFADATAAAPAPAMPDGMQEPDPMAQYEAKAPAAPRLAQLNTNPFGGHDVKRDPTTLAWFESMIENADG